MKELGRVWWTLARSAGEIAWLAPQVMQQRIAGLLRTPSSARNRREATRMVTEKWEAGFAAQAALWQGAWQLQQRLLADYWATALSPQSSRQRAKQIARRGMLDATVLARRSLAPVKRRGRANMRRLRGRA